MSGRYKNYKLSEHKFTLFMLALVSAALAIVLLVGKSNVAVLNPKGWVAYQESRLMFISVALMLIVVIPVFIMTFYISWKFRESNKAEYTPNLDRGIWQGFTWWAIPSVIVFVLAALTWTSAHKMDPYKPLASGVKPITIQVVALQWKWLFIYPEQNIATVNFVQFPAGTPINFELTADAPMNSFWIPSLGGQMYAMPGMGTTLHLIADAPGDFAGSAAEINGRGFSGMKFIARASSEVDFDAWVQLARQFPNTVLAMTEYKKLAAATENNPVVVYADVETDLYNKVMQKFMPSGQMQGMEH